MGRNQSGGYGQNYGPMPQNGYGSNQNNGYNNRPQKKHSGSRAGTGKNQATYINGWNYSRRNGMMTMIACPRKDGKTCVNKNGEVLHMFVCTIRIEKQQPFICTGFYNPNVKKLRIPDLGMTANPYAPNGGYFGKTSVSKRR